MRLFGNFRNNRFLGAIWLSKTWKKVSLLLEIGALWIEEKKVHMIGHGLC
jgi:hypothetical protein